MVSLMEEEPYVAVVADNMLTFTCQSCFISKEDRPLSRCSRCRVVHYCCSDCQKKDWLDHKYECMFLESVSPRIPSSMARMISRIVMKNSRQPDVKAFNGRTFNDLLDHKDDIGKDPERSEFYMCVSHVLFNYMGAKFVPPPATILSIFGKIVTNCISITDETNTKGQALYLGLSIHNHSCHPDAFVLFDGAKAILRSAKRDKKYNSELTISYVDLMATNAERKRELKAQYYFDCNCSVCQDPTWDQWCKSIAVNCCPHGFALLDESRDSLHCYKCGTRSPISMHDAITANQELALRLDDSYKEKTDLNEQLQLAVTTYEKFRMILSPMNVFLALYSQRIRNLALELERNHIAVKYATVAIDAYKRYLTVGHPGLSLHLFLASVCASLAEIPTGAVLELLNQAYESALVSHGPRHPLTSNLDRMMSTYRIRLQRS